MIAAPPRRPPHYHTPRSAPLWLVALRRLWALRLPDGRIAELLSGLSAEAILELERIGWTIERAEDRAAAAPAGGLAWTRRQVLHHRGRLWPLSGSRKRRGLAAHSDGLAAARAELLYRRCLFQAKERWAHLLPSADAPASGRAAGVYLGRRAVEVLSLLRDKGPMTRGELLGKIAVRRLVARGRSLLGCLIRAGLVRLEIRAGRPPVLALGTAAGRAPVEAAADPRPADA